MAKSQVYSVKHFSIMHTPMQPPLQPKQKAYRGGRGRQKREAEGDVTTEEVVRVIPCERGSGSCGCLRRLRKGPCAKGCKQPLEAGKDKEINSLPEPPDGNASLATP